MGNQHSHGQPGGHGHSHNGQPCHGHGPQAGGHGHSHGAQPQQQQHGHSHGGKPCHGHGPQAQHPQHGHSHNGKPCHGHGPQAQQPPPQQHGHSHNGKPCHGHGPQAGGHGHSHGAQPQQQHGHSHDGKPCHGHGPQTSGPPATPSTPQEVEMMKKHKGVQLFMSQMFDPKIPIVWAHFHKEENRDASKATVSSGMTVPYVENEKMTRLELRDFIESYLLAQAHADGHNSMRFIECLQLEMQMLMMWGFQEATKDPEAKVEIPYEKFKAVLHQLVLTMTARRYDAMPFIIKQIGLGDMKLPKLPQMEVEIEPQRLRQYSREKIMPLLIDFIEKNAEDTKDDPNPTIASGFVACTQSIKHGVLEYVEHVKTTKLTKPGETVTPEELEERWTQYIEDNEETENVTVGILMEIDNLERQAIANPAEVLNEIKHHPSDRLFDPNLIAHNIQNLIVIPLLASNPFALKFIAQQWGIELQVVEDAKDIPTDTPTTDTPAITTTTTTPPTE